MTQHAVHHATVGDLLWPTLNFVIFVAVLVHFLRAPAVEYFRARTARLREALQTGARARAEAQALRAALARDVENLPALRAQLRADLRATAERECEALLALGRAAAERIRTDARLLAEHEFAAARAALRFEVIEEALGLSPTVRNLIGLLAERDRLEILADLARWYDTLLDDELGRVRVAIRSATALSAVERNELIELARRLTDRQEILAATELDSELIGGVVLDIGGAGYDGGFGNPPPPLTRGKAEGGGRPPGPGETRSEKPGGGGQ